MILFLVYARTGSCLRRKSLLPFGFPINKCIDSTTNQQDSSECVFDILYLTTLYYLTLKICQRRAVRRENYLLTWMYSSLVVGDSIQLIPRLAVIFFNLQTYSHAVNVVGFLSGAITITLFQRILLEAIECRYEQDSGI